MREHRAPVAPVVPVASQAGTNVPGSCRHYTVSKEWSTWWACGGGSERVVLLARCRRAILGSNTASKHLTHLAPVPSPGSAGSNHPPASPSWRAPASVVTSPGRPSRPSPVCRRHTCPAPLPASRCWISTQSSAQLPNRRLRRILRIDTIQKNGVAAALAEQHACKSPPNLRWKVQE